MADAEEDYSSLPLVERVVHKVWKVRASAYDEVTTLFDGLDESAPEFAEYSGIVKKFVVDSNVMAQGKGIIAATAFVRGANIKPDLTQALVTGVVTKCLNSSKITTKESAIELCKLLIKVTNTSEDVISGLIVGFTHKQPKIAAGTAQAVLACVEGFGVPTINVKPLLHSTKGIAILFNHTSADVRDVGKRLTCELHRWLGPVLEKSLQSIKPVQLKELIGLWVDFPQGSGTSMMLTAKEQKARDAAGHKTGGDSATDNVGGDSSEAVESNPVDIDMYDMAEAVKIKIPSSFYNDVTATKWSDRKEALQNLHKILDTPKIDPESEFQDLIKPLTSVVSGDSNVLNVAFAAKCLGALACGLRGHFQPHAVTTLTVLLEKFKEKKANVIAAVGDACDHVIKTAPPEKFAEHLVVALKNKNPSVKQECANVVCRAVASGALTLTPPDHKPFIKTLVPVLVAKLAESQEPVREAASHALAALITAVGDRTIAQHLDKADALRAAKVREIAAAAPPRGPATSTGGGAPTTRPGTAAPRPVTSAGTTRSRPNTAAATRRPQTATGKENVVPAKTSSLGAKKKSGGSGGAAASRSSGSKFADAIADVTFADMSLEEASGVLIDSGICDGALLEQLADPLWKERLAAATQLHHNVEQLESLEPSATLALYKVIEAKSKSWKDSNFQVMNKNFDILGTAAERAQAVPDRCVHIAVPGLIAKIGDTKVNKHATAGLSVLCENWCVNEVSMRACVEAKDNHSPKVKEETLKWMTTIVEQFGVRIAVKPHVEYSKHCLGHTNPAVRKACVEFLGVLFKGVGAKLKAPFAKEKQATLDILEAEFASAAGESLPAPVRFERGTGGNRGDGGSSSDGGAPLHTAASDTRQGAISAAYDESIPRVLLADIVKKGTLEMMGDKNWKLRAEALDNMVAAVATEQALSPDLGDYTAALLARLSDTNKNLVTTTLNVLAAIGPLMGPPVKKYLSQYLDAVLATLADGKDTVRAAAVAVLDSWHDQIGLAPFVDAGDRLAAALTSGKPHEQCATLVWLRAKLALVAHDPPNAKVLVKPLFACMEDRNKDVRQAATSLFEDLVGYLGPDKLRKAAGSLQGSLKATVVDMLANHSGGSSAAAMAKAPAGKTGTGRPKTAGGSTTRTTSARTSGIKTKTTLSKTAAPRDRKVLRDAGSDAGDPQLEFDEKGKSKRHKDERNSKALKWTFTAPREEFVTQLQEQFKTCANAQLQKMLFSPDFRLHIKALEYFIEALGSVEDRAAAFASVDVLLKWVTLRYFDSNPTVQLKTMAFLHELFQEMSADGIELGDWEAAAFLPFLVNQAGSKLESIRQDIHGLFRLIGHTYPSSKVFQYILDGLKSKNAKQRCECLVEAGSMIERLGMSVCQMGAAKTLVIIAKQIADRDNSVRTAALDCIVAVWNILGEDVFKLMGELQPKHASLVTERIKRHGSKDRPFTAPASASDDRGTARAASPTKTNNQRKSIARRSPSGSSVPSVRSSSGSSSGSLKQEFSLNLDALAQPAHFDATRLELAPTDIDFDDTPIDLDLHHSSRHSMSPTEAGRGASLEGGAALSLASSTDGHSDSGGGDTDEPRGTYVDSIVDNLVSSTPLQAINALKAAEDEFNQDKSFLDVHANAILSACTTQARLLFAVHFQTDDTDAVALAVRLCKHLLGFVLQAFRNSSVIQNVSKDVLSTMISDLLAHVQSPQLAKLAEGSQITKALNCILLKILQSVKPNVAFAILIDIMSTSLHNSALADKTKHIQLVQRCIWKLVKALPEEIGAVDAGDLLVRINEFLAGNPVAMDPVTEDEDIPTRTMRTVVAALVKCKGAAIKDDAGALVPGGGDPYRTAAGYMLLQALTRAGLADGESPFPASPLSTASPTSGMPSDGGPSARGMSSAEEQEERLVQIFAMITSKDETKQGMEALYDFQLQFPAADTDKFLQTTSPFFQTHIRRCLADIKRRRQDRHAANGKAPGTRTSVAPGPRSAATYLDRLRQLTERNRPTTAPAGGAESGGGISRFGFKMPERDGTPELPEVDRGSGDAVSSPPSSPPKVAPSQLASLKARLAKFQKK